MFEICECYRVRKKRNILNEFERWEEYKRTGVYKEAVEENIGVCFGTKEYDECTCGGDKSKCDFYSFKREEAYNSNNSSTVADVKEVCTDVIYKYIDKYKSKSEIDNKIVKVLEEVLEEIKGEKLE